MAFALALAVLVAFQVARADAVPGTQTWTGQDGGATPDISTTGLTFLDTAGDPIPSGGIAGTLNFTLNGVPEVGYCTDTSRQFSGGTEPVDITTETPPATAAGRAVTWILLNRTPSGAPTPDKEAEAGIAQIAIWLLVDAQINKTTPTTDPAVNAAAIALRDEALAATATPASLALSASTPAAGATSSTITVTGKPGAVVSLAVTSGSGALSATSVTLNAGGTGTVTLTQSGPGTTVVSASTAGDGSLVNVNPTDPERRPQPTAAATPSTLSASQSVTFTTTQSTPTPVVPLTPTAPKLALTKTAPARAKVLTRVRYTITVRNTGKVAAKNVVVKDRLPSGLSFVRSSRVGSLSNGVVTYRLGTIAAGKSRTIRVWLLASADVRGTRTNVATVTATNVKRLTARAATIFAPLARRVQPAVTG
jgi:uncharacterized repeat protein (TIGR01451 family)